MAAVRKNEALSTCRNFMSEYVAEIVFFLFKVGQALLDVTFRLYMFQAVCEQQFPKDSSCLHLEDFPDRESAVQIMYNSYTMYYKLIFYLPAIFLSLFCGAWSDRVGRKIPVILSSLGTIVTVLFYLFGMLADKSSGVALILVLVAAAVRGSIGSPTTMVMALQSHVTDVSSEEVRTQKIGRLESMYYLGYFFGSLLAGAILEVAGLDVVFWSIIVVNCLCVIATISFMHESAPAVRNETQANVPGHGEVTTCAADIISKIPIRPENVKESIAVSQEIGLVF